MIGERELDGAELLGPADEPLKLRFFHSFRSPFSYLAVERVVAMAEAHGVELEVCPVLPLAMRGVAIPRTKLLYNVKDAQREAERLGVPFGRICDPIGIGVERCMAAFWVAQAAGLAAPFVRSVGSAVFAEAKTSAGAPCSIWTASMFEPPKE